MKKKKKVIVKIIVIGIIEIIMFFPWPHACGNIKHVNRTIMQSQVYSKQEIENAMEVTEEEFEKEFKGCKLTDLWYDEDRSTSTSDGWAKQYNAKEAIVLLSNFKVDSLGGDGSLIFGETYKDWQWILVRDEKNSGWKYKTCGY